MLVSCAEEGICVVTPCICVYNHIVAVKYWHFNLHFHIELIWQNVRKILERTSKQLINIF